jgi:nicotinamide mononucleotide adenylyltransferase
VVEDKSKLIKFPIKAASRIKMITDESEEKELKKRLKRSI